jgi:hypothetical protein
VTWKEWPPKLQPTIQPKSLHPFSKTYGIQELPLRRPCFVLISLRVQIERGLDLRVSQKPCTVFDHLEVGDYYVGVLTIKEAIGETKPLVLKQFLEIHENFCVVTEWVPIDNAVARNEITKRKRHFNVSKSSFISSVHSDAATLNPRDVLIDESKQADIEEPR